MQTGRKLAAVIAWAVTWAGTTALTCHAASADEVPVQTVTLAGLAQPSDILIDRWGVPHIFAANESDAFFVQGRERLSRHDRSRRNDHTNGDRLRP